MLLPPYNTLQATFEECGTEGKIAKMLSKFNITSLGDISLTTRLGHNRKQNRPELIPLTEIYMNVKQRLGAENAAQLYCY